MCVVAKNRGVLSPSGPRPDVASGRARAAVLLSMLGLSLPRPHFAASAAQLLNPLRTEKQEQRQAFSLAVRTLASYIK